MDRASAKAFSFDEPHRAEARLASVDCLRQHRFEHRLQIARRTADHLEHIGGSRLLLGREIDFAQLAEQPRVLDRDNGLRGKVLHQFNLFAGKRPYLLAIQDDRADEGIFLGALVLPEGSAHSATSASLIMRGVFLDVGLDRSEGLECGRSVLSSRGDQAGILPDCRANRPRDCF